MECIETVKYCPSCKETKPLDSFHKAKERRLGVRPYCKEYQSKQFKINYEKNRENWIKRSSKAMRKHNLKQKYEEFIN